MTAVRVDLPRRLLGQALRRMTFHQQLSLAVGLGVLCVTLLASVASAWQIGRAHV